MNKQMLGKIGPILGLIVSLSTTSFAGYKIFAAPLEQRVVVPSLPSPTATPEDEQEEIVETIVEEVSQVLPTGTSSSPTVAPKFSGSSGSTGASGASASKFPVVTGVSTSGKIEDEDEDEFEDGDDDRISVEKHESSEIKKDEDEHETPETESAK